MLGREILQLSMLFGSRYVLVLLIKGTKMYDITLCPFTTQSESNPLFIAQGRGGVGYPRTQIQQTNMQISF